MRMWQTQLDNLCTSIDYFWSLQPSWSQPSWTQDTCILGLVYKWTNYYRKYELGLPILVTDYIDYHSQETEEITETASWWDWYRQIGFNCPPGLLGGLAGPWCLPRPPLNKQVRPWPKVTGALFHPLSLSTSFVSSDRSSLPCNVQLYRLRVPQHSNTTSSH